MTHPTGWDAVHITHVNAAVLADLVPGAVAGLSRVHFIPEGLACLRFGLRNGMTDEALKVSLHFSILYGSTMMTVPITQAGKGVVVVDAGSSTTDVSAYSRRLVRSHSGMEEFKAIAVSRCAYLTMTLSNGSFDLHFSCCSGADGCWEGIQGLFGSLVLRLTVSIALREDSDVWVQICLSYRRIPNA